VLTAAYVLFVPELPGGGARVAETCSGSTRGSRSRGCYRVARDFLAHCSIMPGFSMVEIEVTTIPERPRATCGYAFDWKIRPLIEVRF
jgi:hypothetical protein